MATFFKKWMRCAARFLSSVSSQNRCPAIVVGTREPAARWTPDGEDAEGQQQAAAELHRTVQPDEVLGARVHPEGVREPSHHLVGAGAFEAGWSTESMLR